MELLTSKRWEGFRRDNRQDPAVYPAAGLILQANIPSSSTHLTTTPALRPTYCRASPLFIMVRRYDWLRPFSAFPT
jgi:hypothetical protein